MTDVLIIGEGRPKSAAESKRAYSRRRDRYAGQSELAKVSVEIATIVFALNNVRHVEFLKSWRCDRNNVRDYAAVNDS